MYKNVKPEFLTLSEKYTIANKTFTWDELEINGLSSIILLVCRKNIYFYYSLYKLTVTHRPIPILDTIDSSG